jgi:hypothetical protein
MDNCVEYYRENIAEITDPEGRKRDVCCEPVCVPCIPNWNILYEYCCHMERNVPYADDEPRNTTETREVRKLFVAGYHIHMFMANGYTFSRSMTSTTNCARNKTMSSRPIHTLNESQPCVKHSDVKGCVVARVSFSVTKAVTTFVSCARKTRAIRLLRLIIETLTTKMTRRLFFEGFWGNVRIFHHCHFLTLRFKSQTYIPTRSSCQMFVHEMDI